ncbi:magnesium-translocating P-type ATPase [Candidatus Kuenenbacteria bacterium HGW-Kuenenbacteria-1]|uniref:Magnesium-transporting ATPase, P-type 1 n=1 Tax=Candidatus Kuenenbacteria bacterium HGW-Kuenenbacteria-1 TaxID=2013812 RepID=A0A2N1UNT8_9BACT|nr:MAG: magnesium-translocating P-type ATPase [Candidatus Kuenenbacteria bacterium HGW-Kuenenbacteria-1]
MQNNSQKNNINNNAEYFSVSSLADIFQKLQTSKNGLTEDEAKLRLTKYGLNKISENKEINIALEFLSHFKSPLIIILLIAATISAYFKETTNAVIIFIMVLASVILDFFEEHSANNAAKKLKEKVSATATVIRFGNKKEIKTSEVCLGDIIFLSSGDLVPADARIIEADDFFVNQSSLTGESFPCEKMPDAVPIDQTNLQNNLVFSSSNVISGTALAIVFNIGQNTEFGKIAKNVLKKDEKSDFELGVTKFGFLIMKVIFFLVLLIMLFNSLIRQDILGSFIFAVAIAVGVTPELLPMIMSIAMARGSQKMAKIGVIVKRLSAIPDFGSMNILCADKTGTLTEDKIELVTYTDIFGVHNEQVFLYTYLNSFHQTGVKNPLDKAVMEYKNTNINNYQKVEEIPFDFTRKMLSIAVVGPEGRTLITKGAPEEIIKKCDYYFENNEKSLLTEKYKNIAVDYYHKLSAEGYRVLAVATKSQLSPKDKYTHLDEEKLELLGFVSFLDPAKKDLAPVLEQIKKYGIEVKVITGDNELVTQKICNDVELKIKGILLGSDIDGFSNGALLAKIKNTTIFARFSPDQKSRVINILRKNGDVIGYLGDGINDAPSLKAADVGISVNNAVDIAKESADIILTKKHLQPIIEGVIEGRRSFGNTMKYIMMGLSSNFGNMFSVLGAIFFIPFLPMLPIQILLNNFIYDISQVTIPTDKVDNEWVEKPRKWDLSFIKKFMYAFGPISSIFDFLTFFLLFFVFKLGESAFQTGWFLESLTTQILVIHIIRTKQIPFLQSRASKWLIFSTFMAIAIGWAIPYTLLGKFFKFSPLPLNILFVIIGLVIFYLILVEIVKRIFYKQHSFMR